ncbi:hypothetical protein ABZ621_11630 [Streptomyces sp. NPDC007863]|uniref:hypothetical protein n=1 Tax=Streptomyces sp. NPDC007863 TaxID=3154894 RepID=UPI0033C3FB42
MTRGIRGLAMGVTLMLGLAACSDGPGGSDDPFSGPVAAPFNPSQVAQALPSRLSAPQGWEGDEQNVIDGGEAMEACQDAASVSCVGLTAMGETEYDSEAVSDREISFGLVAYDSVDNAKVGMKSLLAENREESGDKAKPLALDAGAEESEAYTEERDATVVLRVGTLVGYVSGSELAAPGDLQPFARLLTDRIKVAATGRNPDA